MANEKKLQKAATKFRKENSAKYSFYSKLIDSMAEFIERSGATEVAVGFRNGIKLYESANS